MIASQFISFLSFDGLLRGSGILCGVLEFSLSGNFSHGCICWSVGEEGHEDLAILSHQGRVFVASLSPLILTWITRPCCQGSLLEVLLTPSFHSIFCEEIYHTESCYSPALGFPSVLMPFILNLNYEVTSIALHPQTAFL